MAMHPQGTVLFSRIYMQSRSRSKFRINSCTPPARLRFPGIRRKPVFGCIQRQLPVLQGDCPGRRRSDWPIRYKAVGTGKWNYTDADGLVWAFRSGTLFLDYQGCVPLGTTKKENYSFVTVTFELPLTIASGLSGHVSQTDLGNCTHPEGGIISSPAPGESGISTSFWMM